MSAEYLDSTGIRGLRKERAPPESARLVVVAVLQGLDGASASTPAETD